jgi:hypothetical protein
LIVAHAVSIASALGSPREGGLLKRQGLSGRPTSKASELAVVLIAPSIPCTKKVSLKISSSFGPQVFYRKNEWQLSGKARRSRWCHHRPPMSPPDPELPDATDRFAAAYLGH